jgi:cytochrome P450
MASPARAEKIMTVDEAALAIVDPAAYADGRLERACTVLREQSPVHRVEAPGFRPFYALTRHRDIFEADTNGKAFRAALRYRLMRTAQEPAPGEGVSTLVRMDPPEHTEHRALVAPWFRPRRLRSFEENVRSLAKSAVDRMAKIDSSYDFVTEISMQYPLTVICSMLGIPDADRNLILRMTQQTFGAEDPEYQKPLGDGSGASMDFVRYFAGVVQNRLAEPTDDLSSMLAHATLHGQPLSAPELFAYFGILATAGHDTTSSTIAGGLQALLEHPEQIELLQKDPELLPNAVEEMIRWVSPVKSFMRTAMEDTDLGGQRISRGDAVLLLYPAANRDPKVFEDPETFDVTRESHQHLAFGFGAHFCLGAHLARMEARVFFAELLPRLRSLQPAGHPELVKTLFVGGLKHLPIRADVN